MTGTAKLAARRHPQSRDTILRDLRDYAELFGDAFTSAAFNPATARWRDRADELVDRYYAGNPKTGEPWPSLNSIRDHFGGFNAARVAAGFAPNTPGPKKRPAGLHRPDRSMRIQRVVVPAVSAGEDRLREKLHQSQSEVSRLRGKLRDRPAIEYRDPPKSVPTIAPKSAEPRVITKTKTIRVSDERAAARERRRAERAEAALEQVRSLLRGSEAERKQQARQLVKIEKEGSPDTSRLDVALARNDELLDRASAQRERIRELEDVVHRAHVDQEAIATAEHAAATAEAAVVAAERRAVEACRLVTGESRAFTKAELEELRVAGPAGETILAGALGALAKARKRSDRVELRAALLAVAKAAMSWLDRL